MCKIFVKILPITFFISLYYNPSLVLASGHQCIKEQSTKLNAEDTLTCFLKLDMDGKRLNLSEAVFNPNDYTSWKAIPGWDSLELISNYKLQKTTCHSKETSKECFEVTYRSHGSIESNFNSKLSKVPQEINRSFVLEKNNQGWSIISPGPFQPHVGISATTKHLEKLANDLNQENAKDPYKSKEKIWKLIHKLRKL